MPITFPRGGVHPSDMKARTRDLPTAPFPLPARVILPMSQHIGAPCKPVVEKDQRVLTGQLIGEPQGFVSAPIHATVTGTVSSVEPHPHPVTGARVPSVIIERDGEDEWPEGMNTPQRVEGLTPDEIRKRIVDAGIVGLGGATFPTHVKLSPPPDKPIDTVILNGAECEPYLTRDHRLMLEETQKIPDGFRLIMKTLHCENGIVAIEANKPDCADAFRKIADGEPALRVETLEVKYPQGAEHQLIKALTNREIPWRGGLPMAVGCVVHNVATALAVWEAVHLNRPLIESVITVSGDAVQNPGNFRVRIGTTISEVIAQAGIAPDVKKLVYGGPMMGIAQRGLDAPLIKGASGLLALKESASGESGPCIRCGRCVRACPYGLTPAAISRAAEQGSLDMAVEWNVLECKECGCCTFVCPALRPIVHQVKFAKMELAKKKREKEAAAK